MKITKQKLRRIIKEEKAKLLVEMNPMANAEYMQGNYSPMSGIDALTDALANLLQKTEVDALEDMGDDLDAEEAAAGAVTLTVAQAFQSVGMIEQYQALIKTLR